MRIRLSVPGVLCSTLSLFLLAHEAGAIAAEAGWVELFNCKDLTGWVQRGGKANYAVEDGMIVGSSVLGTDNSFLCTQKEYTDFILELDFKVDPKLNSGVQIRSECFEKAKTWQVDGKEIKIPAGRVHGYQVEIDMEPANKRWWTAGIYDESRRGWLYPGSLGGDKKTFTEAGAKLSKHGEWNHLKVEAQGTSIRTWLNGEPRASIHDILTLKGFIGLQVHGVGKDKEKENLKVQFHNIRIKELTK
jgi:hypothetical protein